MNKIMYFAWFVRVRFMEKNQNIQAVAAEMLFNL